MHRYAAKAAELGVDPATVRRWVARVKRFGPAGLVSERPARNVLDRVDQRWVDTARAVLKGHVKSSRPVRNLILTEIEERLAELHGRDTVPIPARTTGYELLRELAKGTNAFEGSTKESGRSRTVRRASTVGCGPQGRASTWCWTPTDWTCSRWNR